MSKRILTLGLIFSFFISAIMSPSNTVTSHAKKLKQKPYGVFLNLNKRNIKKLYRYKAVVIDAQFFSKEEILKLKKHKIKVYSYINIGSIEKFRPYYSKFKHLALGHYENWDEERWINIADNSWQNFISNKLAPQLLKKGISGFFVDNCDVYYNFPKKAIYSGLIHLLKALRNKNTLVIINGGDTFVTKYSHTHKNLKPILTGINQECVFTSIDFKRSTTTPQKPSVRKFFLSYLSKLKRYKVKIYLLEYTKQISIINKIRAYCNKRKYTFYISPDIELR